MSRNRNADIERYGLNSVMEFDHVIQVHEDGTVTDCDAYAPSLYGEEGSEPELDSADWTLMTHGYTGQYNYNGPIMHNSEFIGGRLADDILATPGYYTAVYCDEDDNNIEGWAVAYKEA